MVMLKGDEITAARLADWRKPAQGLHARFLVADLELVSVDAVHRDDEGTEHVVEWVTQQDVDLARRISEIAGCVPNLWFGDGDVNGPPQQRFHVEVYVAPEAAEQRIAAAVAAGGTVVDDSDAPSLTVISDQEGNTDILCVAQAPADED